MNLSNQTKHASFTGPTIQSFWLWIAVINFTNCVIFCSFSAIISTPGVWLSFLTKKRPNEQRDKTNLIVYGCHVGAAIIFAVTCAYAFLLACLRCSRRLHDKMVVALLQAPVLFFDSNPAERILNRFSKDVGCIDEVLPLRFLFSIQLVLLLLTSIIRCRLSTTATRPGNSENCNFSKLRQN